MQNGLTVTASGVAATAVAVSPVTVCSGNRVDANGDLVVTSIASVWTRQTTGAIASASLSAGISVAYPSGIQAGEILVLVVGCTPAAITFTPSDAGFTARASRTTSGTLVIYTKKATGSESGTFTVGSNSGSANTMYGVCRRYSGGSETVHASATTAATVTNLNYPALTISADGTLLVGAGIKQVNGTAANTPNPPFSSQWGFGHTTSPSCFVVEDNIQITATNVTASNWTITGDASAIGASVLVSFAHG